MSSNEYTFPKILGLRIALVGLAVATLFGCSKDNPIDPRPPAFPFAATPDQLIANFEKVHNDMDFAEYDKLLADGFQFWLSPEDFRLAPNSKFWDRERDVATTQNMFTGIAGLAPDGTVRPSVQSIELSLSPRDDAWRLASDEVVGGLTVLPPGTMRRRYAATLAVNYTAGDIVSQANGDQLFYAVPETIADGRDGSSEEWRLFLWRDFGASSNKTAVESTSWGLVKSFYQPRPE